MELYIEGCRLYETGKIITCNIYICNGIYIQVEEMKKSIPVVDGENLIIAPSFCDLHVHLREPGFEYKETIKSGSEAAAAGGFTTVCAMPNLFPVPDSVENISVQLELIKKSALIEVIPYASITKGEKGKQLSDIYELSGLCCGYSDDGNGVEDRELMEYAMTEVKRTDRFIAAHAEEIKYVPIGWAIHKGKASDKYALAGSPSEAEYMQLKRDIELVRKTGCRYHMCHISSKESIKIIKEAKEEGLPVTCEVTPHHFSLSDADISEDDGRFKMNPPLRSELDREAITEGIKHSVIDLIATDHAPHSREEKSRGLNGSAFGTVGLETAFPAANTYLVKQGYIGYEKLFELMCDKPREMLKGKTASGWVLLDTEKETVVKKESFISKGKSSPFDGMTLKGTVLLTVYNGEIVYDAGGLGSV